MHMRSTRTFFFEIFFVVDFVSYVDVERRYYLKQSMEVCFVESLFQPVSTATAFLSRLNIFMNLSHLARLLDTSEIPED